jgi:hypothetical protein
VFTSTDITQALHFYSITTYIEVMDFLSAGFFVRGLLEMDRGNFDSALKAFKSANDFPGAKRQIASALNSLQRDAREIVQALVSAYENGDLRALPWIVFESERNGFKKSEFKIYKQHLDKSLDDANPEILSTQAKILIINNDYKAGVKLLSKAVNLRDPGAMTFLAELCLSHDLDNKLQASLENKKILELKNWPTEPNFKITPGSGMDQPGVKFVATLLSQGEDQHLHGANLVFLQLNIEANTRSWISEHARQLTSTPELFPSFWNDPEYLANVALKWLQVNTNANLSIFNERLREFGLDDIFLEISEEVRIYFENETLFEDETLFESEFDENPSDAINIPKRPLDTFPIQDAETMFGESLAIRELIEILQNGDSLEYNDKCEFLISDAFKGTESTFLPATQLLQFVIEKGSNFGSYNKYSYYLQAESFLRLFENQAMSVNFIEFLVPKLLATKAIDGGAIKMLHPTTYEGILQAIYFKNGLSTSIKSEIEDVFPGSIEFWDIARRIIFYADEVTNGNFAHLAEFLEVIKKYYLNYKDFESSYFTEDWLWNVSVYESVDIALDEHQAIESSQFISFVLSLLEFDPHFGCKLVYGDPWALSSGYEWHRTNNSSKLFLSAQHLSKIISFGTCDEDTGRDESCLGNFTLVALHPNCSSETLETILNIEHYDSAPKWAVARNPNTSVKALCALAQSSSNSWRLIGSIESEWLNLQPLSEYPAEVQSYIAFAVAVNPSASEEVLAILAGIDASHDSWSEIQLRTTQTVESIEASAVVNMIKLVAKR